MLNKNNTHTTEETCLLYDIADISALQAKTSRYWYASKKTLQFSAHSLKIRISANYHRQDFNPEDEKNCLCLSLGKAKLWISISESFVREILNSFDEEIDFDSSNDLDISLLLELIFSPFFSELEEKYDNSFSLEYGKLQIPAENIIQLSGEIEIPKSGNIAPFQITVPELDYATWKTVLDSLTLSESRSNNNLEPLIPLKLRLNCKSITMDLETIRGLNAGDMIILGPGKQQEKTREIAIGNHPLWLANITPDGGSLAIKQPLLSEGSNHNTCYLSGENTMTENNNNASLDHIPLTVSFEVGKKTISIEELREIKEGSIITFPDDRTDDVQIVINGKEIGYGTLVKVDGSIAVKIEQVFTNG